MAEIQVLDLPREEDLQPFSRFLWQCKIAHRLLESGERQYLLVGNVQDARQVYSAYQQFAAGQEPQLLEPSLPGSGTSPWVSRLLASPITLLLSLLSVVGYLLVAFDANLSVVRWLTFSRFTISPAHGLVFSGPGHEYWRLLTPVFLHFSVLHIVFNLLWLIDLGGRLERVLGSLNLIVVVLLIGAGSNMAQYLFTSQALFGGMSGVIYGLLGYGWVWSRMLPRRSLGIPPAVVGFMIGWLLLCVAGFSELLGFGAVANAAHIGGLLLGVLLGFGAAIIARFQTAR